MVFAALLTEPWWTLAVICVGYLALMPYSYRALRADQAAASSRLPVPADAAGDARLSLLTQRRALVAGQLGDGSRGRDAQRPAQTEDADLGAGAAKATQAEQQRKCDSQHRALEPFIVPTGVDRLEHRGNCVIGTDVPDLEPYVPYLF